MELPVRTNQPRIVVTGFERFGKYLRNSSETVVKALAASPRVGSLVVAAPILPVEFNRCYVALQSVLALVAHDAVVAFGQHPFSKGIQIERLARNRDSIETISEDPREHQRAAPRPRTSESRVIIAEALPTIATRLPVGAITSSLTRGGYPWTLSEDAGAFVCNNLFFHLVADPERMGTPCGFVHLPLIDGTAWTEGRLLLAAEVVIRVVAGA